MEKKFKHKKTGVEAVELSLGDYRVEPNFIIPKAFIHDSSDWEEVKEKEYTILSFVHPSGDIYEKSGKNEFIYISKRDASAYSEENAIKYLNIHSVRRERDKQDFTIKDQMKPLTTDSKNVTLFIEKIELIGNTIHLWGNNYTISLMCAEKAPIRKPILITEDGKEIYEGDNYSLFSVLTKANWQEGRRSIKHALEFSSKWKHFHTKEAREEYIKWNKPMYSLRDVENATFGSVEVTEYLEKLGRK